jgi:hypothetical protein
MYEQDIELAKLLLSRLTELDTEVEQHEAELRGVRHELQQIAAVRDERSQYMDILSRAARLLERADLQVDMPTTHDHEARETELVQQIDDINREAQIYRDLIHELAQRAPALVAAAGGEAHVAVEEADPAAPADEPELEVAPDVIDTEAHVDEPQPAEQGDPGDHPFPLESDADPAMALSRFNVNTLKTKETFAFGRGAAYLVDATSVMDRVPHYDTHSRAVREPQVRDELLRDIDLLTSELSGTFYVVFSSWHQPAVQLSNAVVAAYGTGEDEGSKPAGDRRLRELAVELGGMERSVCIVTGDTTLAEELRAPGKHIISLGDFFHT